MSSQPHVQSFDLLLVSEREGRNQRRESMLHLQTRHLASHFSKTGVNSCAYSFNSGEFHTNWKTFYNHLHSNWSMLCYRASSCPFSNSWNSTPHPLPLFRVPKSPPGLWAHFRFPYPISWEASPAGPTLKCPQTASPHQAASIAKCSATKQALPNTTDAEVGKPEVAKEVGGRK